mmetsp:Transcript_95025/g.306022  ORF Transcript_95025/g.306022 Transcript_95025/m.306022 type:complete len:140 (-) Transcript_95025:67-486(-)
MDDVGLVRHQLSMEESRAERLDHELAEAAAIGRLLLNKNEELRNEALQLREGLVAAENGEREAKEATQRHRELALRARQAAQRETEELRQELLPVEDRAWQTEAASSKRDRDLLTKIERLQRSLQDRRGTSLCVWSGAG